MGQRSTSQYSDDDRRRVIASYAVIGNQAKVAEQENITKSTVHDWVNSTWGQELIHSIRTENQDQMIAGFTDIVQSAIERVSDGLTHGDTIGYTEDGKPVYMPVKARDAIVIAGIATDKMRLLSNQATSITATDGTLTKISEQLAAYARDQQTRVVGTQKGTRTS